MRDEIPILGGKRDRAYALDLAAAHVPLINSAFAAHDECRRDTTEQIRKEVERGLAEDPPHGGNALFLALKEMELAIHSQAMAAAINTLALLAALGVPVPMPLNQDKPDGEVMN
jgi:hypothetical protein